MFERLNVDRFLGANVDFATTFYINMPEKNPEIFGAQIGSLWARRNFFLRSESNRNKCCGNEAALSCNKLGLSYEKKNERNEKRVQMQTRICNTKTDVHIENMPIKTPDC